MITMFAQLLPRPLDNTYHGHTLAIWLLACTVLVKTAMSLNVIFNGRFVASSADGIPLDTFPAAAAQTVIAIFAIWGLAQLVICSMSVLVLVRYRGLIPLMFVLFLLEGLARRLVLHYLPIARTGRPPGFGVNLALLAMTVVGLALSLRWQDDHRQGMTPHAFELRKKEERGTAGFGPPTP
jgi:hypothetical protein